MLWSEMKQKVEAMTEDQLRLPVLLCEMESDTFVPVDHFELLDTNEDDRLVDGHPLIVFCMENLP